MATVRLCCHGNVPSCLTLHFLPTFPLLPIGCERLESLRLCPYDVHNTQFKSNNLSLCSCEKLLLSLWRSYPSLLTGYCPSLPPSLSPSVSMTQSLLLFLSPSQPQNSAQSVSPSHNGLFVDSLHLLLSSSPLLGGLQATAPHTARPAPGGSEHRAAAQGQGKNLLHLVTYNLDCNTRTINIIWTLEQQGIRMESSMK